MICFLSSVSGLFFSLSTFSFLFISGVLSLLVFFPLYFLYSLFFFRLLIVLHEYLFFSLSFHTRGIQTEREMGRTENNCCFLPGYSLFVSLSLSLHVSQSFPGGDDRCSRKQVHGGKQVRLCVPLNQSPRLHTCVILRSVTLRHVQFLLIYYYYCHYYYFLNNVTFILFFSHITFFHSRGGAGQRGE